jgi:hypothetical protein
MLLVTGTILTFAAATLALAFGLVYLVRPQFMYYHRIAVKREWHELPRELQILILVLMRAVSGGFLSMGVSTIILQVAFIQNHQHWIALTILIMSAISTLATSYAVLTIRARTEGRPPLFLVLLFFLMILAGYVMNILG